MNKLLLCCGPTRPPGFIRLDSNPAHEPDIIAEIPPLPPQVLAKEWDVVELIHGIEHFWEWSVRPLLAAVHEVLKPGGLLVLEQPNLEEACRVFVGITPPQYRGKLESAMWAIYGDPAHRDPGYHHKWGWTPETLANALRDSSPWSRIELLPQQYHTYAMGRDFRIEATK